MDNDLIIDCPDLLDRQESSGLSGIRDAVFPLIMNEADIAKVLLGLMGSSSLGSGKSDIITALPAD